LKIRVHSRFRLPISGNLPCAIWLDFAKGAGGVTEAFFFGSEFFEHANVEVGHGDVLAEFDVAAGLEGTTGMAGNDDGEVVVVVTVTI
jgi:hypothetical protein